MFSAIVIVCHLELNVCKTESSPSLFVTEEQCMDYLLPHVDMFNENPLLFIVDYTCLSWGQKA